ncbi:hypothetical protein [Franconibacter helveticus]|uniref:hypothetical protein n=1 Tax=Franconibacter helveticus TaxID=357240 RepID=UPI001EF98ADC|nr:hypothetical protein [Franconibacter helveticus]
MTGIAKLKAAEGLLLNATEISNQLRHLADTEIDSDSFAVVTESYNGREVEFERPITDLAIDAAGVLDGLMAALEAMQRANAAQDDHINQQQDRIDKLEKGHQEAAKQINSWRRIAKENIAEREKDIAALDEARKRIAELEACHSKLRETMAAIHNTITGGGAYTPLAAILNASKRAYEESAAVAGINLETGGTREDDKASKKSSR